MPSLEAEIAQLARFIRSDDRKAWIAASSGTIFIAQSGIAPRRWRRGDPYVTWFYEDPHASRKCGSTEEEGAREGVVLPPGTRDGNEKYAAQYAGIVSPVT